MRLQTPAAAAAWGPAIGGGAGADAIKGGAGARSAYVRSIERLRLRHADFTRHYATDIARGCFDVVVTCFFLDTAKDLFEYVRVIANTLRVGGRWINFGPLQFHDANALPFAADELLALARACGFAFESDGAHAPSFHWCPYVADDNSLHPDAFHALFFSATLVDREALALRHGDDAGPQQSKSPPAE